MKPDSLQKRTVSQPDGFSLMETLLVLSIFALIAGMSRSLFFPSRQSLEAASQIAQSMFRAARAEAVLRERPTRLIICKQTPEKEENPSRYVLRYMGIIIKERNDEGLQHDAWTAVHKGVFLPKGIVFDPEQSLKNLSHNKAIASMRTPYPLSSPVVEAAPNSFEWYYYSFKANGALEKEQTARFVLYRKNKSSETPNAREAGSATFLINYSGYILPPFPN